MGGLIEVLLNCWNCCINYFPKVTHCLSVTEHNKTYLKWFKEKIRQEDCDVDELKWLARGPNFDVITWSGYDIKKFSFYTNTEDKKSTM